MYDDAGSGKDTRDALNRNEAIIVLVETILALQLLSPQPGRMMPRRLREIGNEQLVPALDVFNDSHDHLGRRLVKHGDAVWATAVVVHSGGWKSSLEEAVAVQPDPHLHHFWHRQSRALFGKGVMDSRQRLGFGVGRDAAGAARHGEGGR